MRQGDIALAVYYFKKWKEHKGDSFFLVLTPNKRNADEISRIFAENQVPPDDFRILNPEPEEVPDLLKAGDVGLHLEKKALATEYCIAIKDGEYLAMGLPVICTPYLKGIAPLIEQYDCGMVIDPEAASNPMAQIAPDFEPEKNLSEFFRAKVSPRIMRFKGGFMPAFFPQEPIEKALKSKELIFLSLRRSKAINPVY